MNTAELRKLFRGLGFVSLWLVGVSIFTLYPVVASLYYSFCDYSVLQPPIWIGLENYRNLLQDDVFYKALANTAYFAALSLPLGIVVSLALAILLNCKVRLLPLWRTIFYLPSLVPVVASAILWQWIFNGQFGLLNWLLASLGFDPPSWLGDPRWAKDALVIMSLWGVGNSVVIYLAGLQEVPEELYEQAQIDGAGWWRRIWHVTLPMISPVIYFNLIMGIIGTLQMFANVYVMFGGASGAPARSTLLYTLYLYSTAFEYLRMGYASAMAWILFIIIVVLTLFADRLARRRVFYSG